MAQIDVVPVDAISRLRFPKVNVLQLIDHALGGIHQDSVIP